MSTSSNHVALGDPPGLTGAESATLASGGEEPAAQPAPARDLRVLINHMLSLGLDGSRTHSLGSASSLFAPAAFAATGTAGSDALPSPIDTLPAPANADDLIARFPSLADLLTHYVRFFPEAYLHVWRALAPLLVTIEKHVYGQAALHLDPPSAAACPTPPPHAPARRKAWTNVHGDEWHDDYAWLHDRDDPDVLAYIAAENAYTTASLKPTATLQRHLYREFVARTDEDEATARVTLSDGWTYYARKVAGQEYRQHVRERPRRTVPAPEAAATAPEAGADADATATLPPSISTTAANAAAGADELEVEVYLDENVIADLPEFADATFFRLGCLRHSPCGRWVAFGIDSRGDERYTFLILDLQTHTVQPKRIPGCWEDWEFSADGDHAYYLALDANDRAYRVMRHAMADQDPVRDVVLWEDTDDSFYLTMTKSGDGRYVFVNSGAQVTSETRYIDLDEVHAVSPTSPGPAGRGLAWPRVVFPRTEGVQYTVKSRGDHLYVLTNEGTHRNNWLFRVDKTAAVPTEAADAGRLPHLASRSTIPLDGRDTVIAARDFVLIEDCTVRARHLVVFERSNCLQNVRVIDLADESLQTFHYISFSDPVYSLWPMTVSEEVADLSKQVLFPTATLRYTYTSFVQPKQVVDYDMDARTFTIVHEERVCGPTPYSPDLYASVRLFPIGEDGTAIPLSLVFRRDLVTVNPATGRRVPNPLLLHAYGAYGSCVNPIFSTQRLSLLDRGFIFAIAHVRGGADLGNAWYEDGKNDKKPNTFKDFISCISFLLAEGYTTPDLLAIYGRSAGGLLIGAVVNAVPHLVRAALTEVPFVDVINTMFDTSIPWTTFEYEEWGDPNDRAIYDVMRAYCPYTNVRNDTPYPHMMVVGGMNDPRVSFFEPVKYVAKLRASKPPEDDRLLLLRVDDVGHCGSSGQYSYLEDLAQEYAFLIYTLGASPKPIPLPFATGAGVANATGANAVVAAAAAVAAAMSGTGASNGGGAGIGVPASATPNPVETLARAMAAMMGPSSDVMAQLQSPRMLGANPHDRYRSASAPWPTSSSAAWSPAPNAGRRPAPTAAVGTGNGSGAAQHPQHQQQQGDADWPLPPHRAYKAGANKKRGDRGVSKVYQWLANFF
ncbi:hypothetical protein H9P43_000430 [Blastocladiella emersonii ATCC 22665]|nr:hypothetical protein H9P43_000430 [Blastocladiella emersonii ATCC 22665]